MRLVRVYHGGRNEAHRARERALVTAGVDVTLVVPQAWPEGGEAALSAEPFRIVELPVERAGDVNRHRYRGERSLGELLTDVRPDVLDIHEEPFSSAAKQWLSVAPPDLPVVMYAAQNVDKRLPPPFQGWETSAYRRTSALYPCSRQAASVARGKGFAGRIDVLPLGYDDGLFRAGEQSLEDPEIILVLSGRLVPEKGVRDAVHVLARLNRTRPARLIVCGDGPENARSRALASHLGVADRLELSGWRSPEELAAVLRTAHVVLVPSRPTWTWAEQFGRVITEAQASGAVVAGYANGAIPEVAAEGGLLVRTGDADGLADSIVALLSDSEEFHRLRLCGFASARERTWPAIAAAQCALYGAALTATRPVALPRSPRLRRAAARSEFGPPASTLAGERPFALPVVRRGGPVARGFAGVIDATAELAARLLP